MSVRHLPDTATPARLSDTRLPSRPRATMATNTFTPYVCSHFHPDSAYHSTDLQSPPQDDPAHRQRIWFAHSSASYQSGASPASASASPDIIERGPHHDWQTTYGMRVDVLSAFAYLLGPISGSALSFSSRVLPSQLGIFSPHLAYPGNTQRLRSFPWSAGTVIVGCALNMTACSIPSSTLDDSSRYRTHPRRGAAISVVDRIGSDSSPLCIRTFNGVRVHTPWIIGVLLTDLAFIINQRSGFLRCFKGRTLTLSSPEAWTSRRSVGG